MLDYSTHESRKGILQRVFDTAANVVDFQFVATRPYKGGALTVENTTSLLMMDSTAACEDTLTRAVLYATGTFYADPKTEGVFISESAILCARLHEAFHNLVKEAHNGNA